MITSKGAKIWDKIRLTDLNGEGSGNEKSAEQTELLIWTKCEFTLAEKSRQKYRL